MSRRFIAIVALLLSVLLPVRGFAAQIIATCVMNGGVSVVARDAVLAESSPCHQMANTDDGAASQDCASLCSSCATSCAAPVVAPHISATVFDKPLSPHLPCAECNFQSAQPQRADKPPVL